MENAVSQIASLWVLVPIVLVVLVVALIAKASIVYIPSTKFGVVQKRFGKKLPDGQLIALNGEAGYQADFLAPGTRFKLWPLYRVTKHDLVQIPPGAIGVVIAQVGEPLPSGAKTAVYNPVFGDFTNVRQFLSHNGQNGVQRPVLRPGTTVAIHPIAFVVVTLGAVFGIPISKSTESTIKQLDQNQLRVTTIAAPGQRIDTATLGDTADRYMTSDRDEEVRRATKNQPRQSRDIIGVVTTLEGPPLPSGDIAGRLGGFEDIKALEATQDADTEGVIQTILGTKNNLHNNYQDFQAFLDAGGCIGLQHDPLLYGTYALNPFLVRVEQVPMLIVDQGETAVVKSYVGLPAIDTSGADYKFGSIVAPGHRGVWAQAIGTGKYALNPRTYDPIIVPTSILTLNWANDTSSAHNLDARLSSISAKSSDAFDFKIDLQVLIHVPDVKAPKVISMVGTMENLINEVLQSAVGNYFRNTLQGLPATSFIATREEVQQNAEEYIKKTLAQYDVEVRGVYIQDVILPEQLVSILNDREIAKQQRTTFDEQQLTQKARIDLEAQRGVADMQAELAKAKVSVDIKEQEAQANVAQARGEAEAIGLRGDGEAKRIQAVGVAEGAAAEAVGKGQAAAYEAQQAAIGPQQTALIAFVKAIGDGNVKITPDTLVSSGANGAGGLSGLLELLSTNMVTTGTPNGHHPERPVPATEQG